MIKKPATCEGCPLYTKGKDFVPDKVAKKPRIVAWGEAPGKQEVEQGEPFVGPAGFVLKSWLMKAVPEFQVALERGEVTFANTLRCLPPVNAQGRPYPTGEEKQAAEAHCRQYDPPMEGVHTVVLFGESPQRAFFGHELSIEDATDRQLKHDMKGVSGRVGRMYERSGVRYIFNLHPSAILKQPAMVTHGQMALRIAVGTEKELVPEYKLWEQALGEMK